MDPTEKLTIETPEQITLEFPLAGVGSRGLALCVDSLIQVLAAAVVAIIVALASPDLARNWVGAKNWMTAILIFCVFCLYWGYFAAFEILWNGQTPGKRQAKIRVISASGRPITVFEGIARNLMRAIDSFGLYAVGCISCAIDKKNRRLGDMVAGTVVVHEVEEQVDAYWYGREKSAYVPSVSHASAVLTAQEFQLIEAFLARRLDIPNLQRLQSAQLIADRIGDRLDVPREQRPVNEDFLEEVARQYRDSIRR
ncbi:MAG TPA: RDD family protein [Verrucomicrobiae bacterium]|nr:RDD family protein [Verrucomicrobiae bacterium]